MPDATFDGQQYLHSADNVVTMQNRASDMTSLASIFTAQVSNTALLRSIIQHFAMTLTVFLPPQVFET